MGAAAGFATASVGFFAAVIGLAACVVEATGAETAAALLGLAGLAFLEFSITGAASEAAETRGGGLLVETAAAGASSRVAESTGTDGTADVEGTDSTDDTVGVCVAAVCGASTGAPLDALRNP